MTSPYDLGVPGGVQGQVVGLSAALRALGHEVVDIAPGHPSVRPDLVTVGRATGVRANGSVAPVALSPATATRARRAVRESGADVVHLHEPFAPMLNYGLLVAGGPPLVGTFHRSGASVLYRALGPLARWVLGRLDARCAVSESARAMVAPFARGEVEVLFNGVDIERYRGAVPVPTSGPTVLFVGRHEPRKGLGVLLDAVDQMAEPPVLWVAGAGPQTTELRSAHPPSERLLWLGAITEEEKATRLAGADVLCAPSLGGESFGMVLLEGMAAGCAVVASDIDGYRQAAGGHARLVPPEDPAALGLALEQTLARVATAGAEIADARRAAAEYAAHWSMSALARRYLEIYERVRVGAKGRGDGSPAVA
jgi:phosphatidylinositol alpha-mannosyltransferase